MSHNTLDQYVSEIDALMTSTIEKESFSRILARGLVLLELEQKEFAYQLDVSPPTVHRWVAGKNMPYQIVARAVLAHMKSLIEQKNTQMPIAAGLSVPSEQPQIAF